MSKKPETSQRRSAGAQRRIQRILLEALAEARSRNPAYSLRAMSRRLKISPAALSEILNGKRDVSVKLAAKILKNVGADPTATSDVLAAFKPQVKNASPIKKEDAEKTRAFSVLSADQFKTIAEWYHFAILSLFETTSCPQTPVEIAKRLNVRSSDIAVALERLERLGMLIREEDGRYGLTGAQFHTSDDVASSAIKASHAQSFQMAQKSLEEGQLDRSDFTSLTMAINPDKMAQAKKMIREFRMHLARELEVDPKQEVYMLCVQLFPLSKTPSDEQS